MPTARVRASRTGSNAPGRLAAGEALSPAGAKVPLICGPVTKTLGANRAAFYSNRA